MSFQNFELSSANRPEFLPDETLLFVQDEVGLYEGRFKLPDNQNGHIYLTSHRICYVDNAEPRRHSLAIPLKSIERAEYSVKSGFFKSSPKISLFRKFLKQSAAHSLASRTDTLSLNGSPQIQPSPFTRSDSPLGPQSFTGSTARSQRVTWVCPICSFSNTLPAWFDATVANEQTPLPPCQTCGIKPPLAHLLKAAISSATSRESQDGFKASPNTILNSNVPVPSSITASSASTRPSHICPRCTFENHPSLQACEICGASLVSLHEAEFGKTGSSLRTDSPGPVLGAASDERADCVKLSFRAGGDKIFHERLKGALIQRKWLSDHAPPVPQPHTLAGDARSTPGSGTQTLEPKGVGIAGLERRGLERRRNNEAVISTAFEDLEALMASAQDIITIAESFADKSSDASASDIISDAAGSLSTTKDMLNSTGGGSDSLYLSELSRELAEYLTNDRVGVLRRAGGIMSLVDLWAEFNDLRNGVELISPSDFEKAARLWEKLVLPVRLREFRNGLLVVQRHDRTDDKTIAEILAWLQELHESQPNAINESSLAWNREAFGQGVTAREAAIHFGWSVGVATEELEMAEENGMLCREESIEGLKFWENWIIEGLDNFGKK